jgi:mRNA-degrading endonuclease RelE of RelBE toxin-antitoxin system
MPQSRLVRIRSSEISEKARKELRELPKGQRRTIGYRIEQMRGNLQGDETKLKDQENRYRLRIGSYRVIFGLAGCGRFHYSIETS